MISFVRISQWIEAVTALFFGVSQLGEDGTNMGGQINQS